jgi:acetoin utilization deacetylase AcuC-like enzyme
MALNGPLLVVDDPIFDRHRAPSPHPERPERLVAARAVLDEMQDLERLPLSPRDATAEELARVHREAYVDELTRLRGDSGYLDADTYFGTDSVGAATRAAGGCIALTEDLMRAPAGLGLALVRPPGHHATPSRAMGFCLLNNVALAAAAARARGAERVAIVDWDVHHGNGTQDAFEGDPSVLYVSLHQSPFYPGTGAAEEVGSGDARGTIVNVPLSAGAGPDVYAAAITRLVAPVVEQFRPDLLLVSAGFDAHVRDPLAEMRLNGGAYAAMARELVRALPTEKQRVGLILEGGYDLVGLADGLRATLEALRHPDVTGPGTPTGAPDVGPRHAADLQRAIATQRDFWRLY